MNDNEKEFEKFARGIKFDDTPDLDHRDKLEQDLLTALDKPSWQKPQSLRVWRAIMKPKIAKLATAAIIIIALVLGLVAILDHTTTPAWAVENTAKALDQFNAVYICGTAAPSLEALREGFDAEIVDAIAKEPKDGPVFVEFWARANEQRTRSGNIKVQAPNGWFGVADDSETYVYEPNTNTVYVQQGCHIMIDPWLSGNFLLRMREFTGDWQVLYGKDSTTGQDLALIICRVPSLSHSMWIEIDLETNLPVRLKIWHNAKRQGAPAYDMQRIVFFKELPDEMFEFEIPEGATVIEE